MLAIMLLYVCFTGTVFLNSFIMSKNHYPLFVSGSRIFASGLILLTLYFLYNRRSFFHQIKALFCWPFLRYTLCLYTVSSIGFSWGMQYIDPIKSCFIFVLAPFITALILYFWYDEQLTYKKMLGLLIGFIAVIPIILESNHGYFQQVPWYLSYAGYCIFACAVVSYSYGWILHKNLIKMIPVSSSLLTGAALTIGGATTLVLHCIVSKTSIFSMPVTDNFWYLLAMFSMVTTIGYNLYALLLRHYSPTFISFAGFLEPAFGIIFATIFLGHQLSLISCIALAILGLGLYLFYQEELHTS